MFSSTEIVGEKEEIKREQQPLELRLEPTFFAALPEQIEYAEEPSAVDNKIQLIDRTLFEKEEKIVFSRSQWITQNMRDALFEKEREKDNVIIPQIEARLLKPISFTIVKINQEIGKGLFYSKKATESLSPGTVLGIYTGEVKEEPLAEFDEEGLLQPIKFDKAKFDTRVILQEATKYDEKEFLQQCNSKADAETRRQLVDLQDTYILSLDKSDFYKQASIVDEHFKKPTVSARKIGGEFRYMLSFPKEEELGKVTNLDHKTLAAIRTANVIFYPIVHRGVRVTAVITIQTINPGDPIGPSYEDGWPITTRSAVFDNNGVLMGHFKDANTIEIDKAFLSQNPTLSPAPRSKSEPAVVAFLQNPIKGTYDYQESFKQNVNHALDVFLKRYADFNDKSKIKKLLKNLQQEFNHQNSVENQLKKLTANLKVNSNSMRENLSSLKNELELYIKQYNEANQIQYLKTSSQSSPMLQQYKFSVQSTGNIKGTEPTPSPSREELQKRLRAKTKRK